MTKTARMYAVLRNELGLDMIPTLFWTWIKCIMKHIYFEPLLKTGLALSALLAIQKIGGTCRRTIIQQIC